LEGGAPAFPFLASRLHANSVPPPKRENAPEIAAFSRLAGWCLQELPGQNQSGGRFLPPSEAAPHMRTGLGITCYIWLSPDKIFMFSGSFPVYEIAAGGRRL
jgi:hypothetical protein